MIFKTVSGSVYEINRDKKCLRRLSGTAPSKHPQDFGWRKFLAFFPNVIEKDSPVLILWDTGSKTNVPTTRTSPVVQIGN